MSNRIDPVLLSLCKKVVAKRPKTVIDHILKHGHITTEELQTQYGYDHPPRAARDVRENGIPLETFWLTSARTGRKIGAYRFADISKIRSGRVGGRKAFSKAFKDALLARYDSRDAITSEKLDGRYLQIDHCVPYEVAGDSAHDEADLEAYMLLDASSQRAKSWSCEHCTNWTDDQDEAVCRRCFWAFPEDYDHIAGLQARRLVVEWRGAELDAFEALRTAAAAAGVGLQVWIKARLSGK